MKLIRHAAIIAAATTAGVVVLGAPALAGHAHYLRLPTGACQQVAAGSTSIADANHAAFHNFHEHVHLGATEGTAAPDSLGDGHAAVNLYKDGCP